MTVVLAEMFSRERHNLTQRSITSKKKISDIPENKFNTPPSDDKRFGKLTLAICSTILILSEAKRSCTLAKFLLNPLILL